MKNSLKAKRIAAKLTLEGLSKACKISCSTLHGLEDESAQSQPRIETAYKLAGFFDIPVTEIWPNDFKHATKTMDSIELEAKEKIDALIFVGYTNGYQILYAAVDAGTFYPDTDNECWIPLYMLEGHVPRLESTSDMTVTLEKLKAARVAKSQ